MTGTQLAPVEPAPVPALSNAFTAAEVRARVNLIQEVMRGVMKNGHHYGTIPGAGDKPALFKPGAEQLAVTFRIAVDPVVDDLSTSDEAHFRVTCRAISQVDGSYLGSGVGEASSSEEKYRWRKAVCDEEFDATPEDRRRVKFARGKGGTHYTINQVRTVPADVANTVLKMAKKRAQVDMTLTVTGASDIFCQDIEDLPEELRDLAGDEHGHRVTTIGEVAYAILLETGDRKGRDEKQLIKNARAKLGHQGELRELTTETWERLMAGLLKLPDVVEAEADEVPDPADAAAEQDRAREMFGGEGA
jgi:hypothetical protein